ncbi:hypothetical protein CP965_13270, partial [Halarcobacter mediterraneus]
TANAVKGDKEKFLSLGMDGYLSKPINTSDLYKLFDLFLIKNENMNEGSNKNNLKDKGSIDINEVINKLGVSEKIALLLVDKFKKDILNDLEDLGKLIKEEKKDEISKKAHYIKNSCLNISLDDICSLLQKLESNEFSIDECKSLYIQIEQKIKAII